jgi:hypothetical protein
VTPSISSGPTTGTHPNPSRWSFVDGEIHGKTPVLDGAKRDPESSSFLASRGAFGGNIVTRSGDHET